MHTKSNSDGYKVEGITFPGWKTQRDLLIETYEDVGIDTSELAFMEAHATGTLAGDPVESKAIAEAVCKNRKEPLLVGAVKSNIGHTEVASGLCAIAKVIIANENKAIPANIHLKTLNPNIPELFNGKLKIVTETTPFNGEIVGVNNWGFGGGNVHAILKMHDKVLNEKSVNIAEENFPRLIIMCGRTEFMLKNLFDFLVKNPNKLTREFCALLNDISKSENKHGMIYRGFLMVNKEKEEIHRIIKKSTNMRPIVFVFSGMGCQWPAMAQNLMHCDIYADSIKKSAEVLKTVRVS